MCGIVGYVSTHEQAHKDEKAHFMRFALALDTLRGKDSTGIMTLREKFDVNTVRTTMPGDRFVHSPRYKEQFKVGWAQVGHNRAATKGGVKLDNAHPFNFGPVTLVHNGTLWGGGTGLPSYNKDLEVDSMQIAFALSKVKPENAKKVIEKIDGSFALVWFDKRDESINMARNSDRPMHFGTNRAKTIMWFMSDGNHLYSVNKSFGNHNVAANAIFQLDKHKVLKWKKGSLVPEVTTFVPFMPYTQRKSGKTSTSRITEIGAKGKETALERATNKWKRDAELANGTTTKNSDSGNALMVRIGNSGKRSIPNAHLESLLQEYDLTPSHFLKFIPETYIKQDKHHQMVVGRVIHDEWGDSEWKAVVHDVKNVQANAYKKRPWLVSPVGIAHPWDHDSSCPSMLCHLVHCDWPSYQERLERENDAETASEKDEAQDEGKVQPAQMDDGPIAPSASTHIVGPEGIITPYGSISAILERGCVSCGGDLMNSELRGCTYVNEGRDILCVGCIEDWKESTERVH